MVNRYFILAFLLHFSAVNVPAQDTISGYVNLDAFIVSAGLQNFDKEDFIKQVVSDSTFYQAFLNLKYYPHQVESQIIVYHKDEKVQGQLNRSAQQYRNALDEMWIEIMRETSNGKIKKNNGEWKYLTAEMYDDIFFPKGKQKVSKKIDNREQELVRGSAIEKHKAQLKKMLFNPGEPIDNVPFIGDKLAIFSPEMLPHYDFSIYAYNWADTVPCVVFSAYTKKGSEDETVIHDMTSYFHRDTHEVIAREYRLAHNTIFFDFDISIIVHNALQNGVLLPQYISYDGEWDVPLKKPEIVKFDLRCGDYKVD